MGIYVKNIFYFHICLFLFFKHDFIRCVDFTRIAASTQQVMTSQIRSHIKYLIQTYYIHFLIFSQYLWKI